MNICIICNEEFEVKKIKKGKINECDDCTQNIDDIKYLGFNDGTLNKASNISVYRGTDAKTRKMISNQRARTGGF